MEKFKNLYHLIYESTKNYFRILSKTGNVDNCTLNNLIFLTILNEALEGIEKLRYDRFWHLYVDYTDDYLFFDYKAVPREWLEPFLPYKSGHDYSRSYNNDYDIDIKNPIIERLFTMMYKWIEKDLSLINNDCIIGSKHVSNNGDYDNSYNSDYNVFKD